jgi:hypothetical protein
MRTTGMVIDRMRGNLPGGRIRRTFRPMIRRLARILLVGFCVTMVAQQTNLGSLLFGDECQDNCPDSSTSHRCPLSCTSCACVGHGTPVTMALPVPFTVRPVVIRVARDKRKRLPDPQPDAIFHVPKPILV